MESFKIEKKNQYERKFQVNVLDFGAVPDFDGTNGTDNTQAFSNAINYLYSIGGGTLYFKGKYKITQPLIWKPRVSLKGEGAGISVLVPFGRDYSAITGLARRYDNPYEDCTFENFEIDCSNLGDPARPYTVFEKAIYIQYMRRFVFRDLYLHDSPATALGVDFLDDSIIDNVVAVRAGRLFDKNGTITGGSGIGIGTGAYEYENLKIVNCEARDCGNHGIFVEIQGNIRDSSNNLLPTQYSKGIRIVNCNVSGNGVSGITDSGVSNLTVDTCEIHDNDGFGYKIILGGKNGKVTNCRIYNNAESGVYIDNSQTANANDYKFDNNDIYNNGKHGIRVDKFNSPFANFKVINNKIYNSGANGISLKSSVPMTDIVILNNEIYSNGQLGLLGEQQGVHIEAIMQSPKISNNRCYDRQTTKTQTVGIKLFTGFSITDGEIKNNDCSYNLTAPIIIDGTLSGNTILESNNNYNYDNSIKTLTPTASPWTYTAGNRPEVLYLTGTGITISINGTTVLNNVTNATVNLQALQGTTITYTTLTSAKSNLQ